MMPEQPPLPGRVLYENGTVLPMDGSVRKVEALVTDGDKILGVGTREDMRTLAGAEAERIDLDGATLMPGIIDSHPHAMHFAGFELGFVNLLDATSHEDIAQRISAAAAEIPEGQWILTTPVGDPHYFVSRSWRDLAEGCLPDRHLLDRVAPKHPVHIMAWAPTTPNACAFNTAGLQAVGLSHHFPEHVCSVHLERESDGGLTGRLFGKVNNYYSDDPFWHYVTKQLPQAPDEMWFGAGLKGMAEMASRGVTAIYEGHAMAPPHVEAYLKIRRAGLMTTRVMQSLELSSYAFNTFEYTEAEVWGLLELGAQMKQVDDPLCRVDGVTLSRGGPIEEGFFRMDEPYKGPDGELTRGRDFFSRDLEKAVAKACLERDLRLNMVLGGYRDHAEFAQTCEELSVDYDVASKEWVLQHCMMAKQEHVEALAKYRLHATMSCSFVWGSGKTFSERVGDEVLRDLVPLKRFKDAGMNLSCGTDWGPGNVFVQMAINETREMAGTGGKQNLHDDHILSREDSLLSFTRNGALTMRWKGIGTLEPGNMADLCIIDRDPVEATPEALGETQVLRTTLGGVGIFDTGAVKGGAMRPPMPPMGPQGGPPPGGPPTA